VSKYRKLPKSVSRNRVWHLAVAVSFEAPDAARRTTTYIADHHGGPACVGMHACTVGKVHIKQDCVLCGHCDLWHGIEARVTCVWWQVWRQHQMTVVALIIAMPACICTRYHLIFWRRNIASLLPVSQYCLTWLFGQPVSTVWIRGSNFWNEHRFTEPWFTTLEYSLVCCVVVLLYNECLRLLTLSQKTYVKLV